MSARALAIACMLGASACVEAAPELGDLREERLLAEAVDAGNLMPTVERLASDHARDRKLSCEGYATVDLYPSCELSRDAARDFVRETLEQLGYDVETLEQGREPHVSYNVVAEQRGTTRPDEVVLVAAHFDAFYAGADDNSSGVSVMLELARTVLGRSFARTVRFVGFDLEERYALGATRYAAAGHADEVVSALILESVGYADHSPGSQEAPLGLQLGDVGDSLLVAGNHDSLELTQRFVALGNALGHVRTRAVVAAADGAFFGSSALLRSDNGPLWLRGIPALMLTDSANFRNPHYHKASDTPDTLDPEFLEAVARTTAGALAHLAELSP